MSTFVAFIVHVVAAFLPALVPLLPGVGALSASLDECADVLGDVVASTIERLGRPLTNR